MVLKATADVTNIADNPNAAAKSWGGYKKNLGLKTRISNSSDLKSNRRLYLNL